MGNIRFHQGDVIGATMNEPLPINAVPINNKPIALGELSGHIHVVTGDVKLFTLKSRMFVVVGENGARLQHLHKSNFSEKDWDKTTELKVAEHKNILLDKGNYELWIQKCYNPFEKAMEDVID